MLAGSAFKDVRCAQPVHSHVASGHPLLSCIQYVPIHECHVHATHSKPSRSRLTWRGVVPGRVVYAHAGRHEGPKVYLLPFSREITLAQRVQARKLQHSQGLAACHII